MILNALQLIIHSFNIIDLRNLMDATVRAMINIEIDRFFHSLTFTDVIIYNAINHVIKLQFSGQLN